MPIELPGGGEPARGGHELGEAEVGQVAVFAGEEDVARLDVAVHEPLGVGGIESASDLPDKLDRAVGLEPSLPLEQALEIDPLDVAHGDVESAPVLAGVVDGDDVGVIDRRGNARLAQKPLAEALVLGEVWGQKLERHLAPQPLVVGAVDDAHTTAADQRLDPIAGKVGADTRIRSNGHDALRPG